MNNLTADAELMKEFLNETAELLSSLNNDLASLESDPRNTDLLNRIFRAIHTIKGTSNFLGFEQLVKLSHAAEDVLHMTRNGERRISPEVMDILLDAVDKIKILVGQIERNAVEPIELADLLCRLGRIRSGDVPGSTVAEASVPSETTEKIHFITSKIQTSVLKTRMVPIERLFRKYPRMIRDMARDLGKSVELVVSGRETELDKTVIDQLGDSLVHLLRNAMDHGIETSDVREKLGKQRSGTIRLSASQEGNHILVRIQDDGRGIDLERVKRKAVERGLVTQDRLSTMDRKEALALIFESGFSTAEEVSSLSSRGVGMDVVRTNIRNLSGIIDIQTEIDKGIEVLLKLPLTLAVIPALMVRVSDDIFAIPLASVVETLQFEDREIVHVGKGGFESSHRGIKDGETIQ